MRAMRWLSGFLVASAIIVGGCDEEPEAEGNDGGTASRGSRSSGGGGRAPQCGDDCRGYCEALLECLAPATPTLCLEGCGMAAGEGCDVDPHGLVEGTVVAAGVVDVAACNLLVVDACERGVTTTGCADAEHPCDDYCGELCAAAADCGSELSTEQCESQCRWTTDSSECGYVSFGGSTGVLDCASVFEQLNCSSYCDTFCDAVEECNGYASPGCVTACTDRAFTCNVGSIEARSCEQLVVEAGCYDGSSYDSICYGSTNGSGAGLCADSSNCPSDQACQVDTSVCGGCSTAAECADGRDYFSDGLWTCEQGACVELECADDGDCSGSLRRCDVETNTCVECNEDSQCSSSFGVGRCELDTHTCVDCFVQDDCEENAFGGILNYYCHPETSMCVMCIDDDDCSTGVCDPASNTCVGCVADGDCEAGVCNEGTQRCEACLVDTDCPTGQVCNLVGTNACVECTSNSDCESGFTCMNMVCGECANDLDCTEGRCDVSIRECVECLGDADCGDRVCSEGSCVECLQDVDCGNQICNIDTQLCVPCTQDDQCGADVCDVAEGTCVECVDNGDCGATEVCNASNVCVITT